MLQEPATDQPIPDARVVILETGVAGFTDGNGRFAFTVPAPGYYTFRVILAGAEVRQIRRQVRFSGETLALLSSAPIDEGGGPTEDASDSGEGIAVVGLKDQTKLSRFRFSRDEIKRLPGVYGDSLKAIETLPGVSAAPPIGVLPTTNILSNSTVSGLGVGPPYANSQSGVLVIRGAGPRASQFFLDGLKVQYPFHLGDQSSVINNDYIRTVDVYTGTYPVRFGNATGGVISIEGPTKIEQGTAHINVSMFKSDVFYETPLFGGIGYFIGTARQSYPNYPLLLTYPEAIPANAQYANYTDGQFKLGFEFNNRHELAFLFFGARDILDYARSVDELANGEDDGLLGGLGGIGGAAGGGVTGSGNSSGLDSNTDGRPPVGLDRGFHTQGMNYAYSYGGVFRNRLIAQVSRFKEDFDLDFRSPLTGETIFGYEVLDFRREFQVRDEMQFEVLKKHIVLNAGLEHNDIRWELSLRNFSPQQSVNPNTPDFVEVVNDLVESNRTFRSLFDGDSTAFQLNAYYAELELAWWRFRLTPGVRSEWYSLSNSTGVGPRMGLEFQIPESDTTLLAGAGRHFNVPPGLNYISIEAGNPWLDMEEADRMAAGVEQKIGKHWLIKVEAFRNIFRNLVVEDRFVVAPFSPRTNRREQVQKPVEVLTDPLENRFLNFSNDGTGWSEGFEVYIKKTRPPRTSGWFGWISYTNSLTKRNNHQTRLTTEENQELQSRNLNRSVVAYIEQGRNVLNYYDSGELEIFYDNDREELYDLDRTHQISLVVNYKFNAEWQIGGRWRYSTNTPFTPIVGNGDTFNLPIIGRPTFLARYSDRFNSDRLHPVHQLDIRLDRFLNYGWGYANYYVELINFYARRNPESQSFDFLSPYNRGSNPATTYESTFIETPTGGGRKLLLPLINVGLELKF
ncbi:MAG: TonB-dependent receptor plug domain-containing protein [bacterium]|nr:TonB-dependent receptor plug domain-containing protein [bacterium]